MKREVTGNLDEIITKLTESLKTAGFGVLTRIDMHEKFKEKLGKDIPATVILGACNPQIAYEAYKINTDITALVPCNAVVRHLGPQRYSVELVKPSAMLETLGISGAEIRQHADGADKALQGVLNSL